MKQGLIILFLLASYVGQCCTCERPNTVSDEYQYSNVVFQGKVLSIQKVSIIQTLDTSSSDFQRLKDNNSHTDTENLRLPIVLEVQVQVLKGYKGAEKDSVITIYTPSKQSSCGYAEFAEGEKFVVYGSQYNLLLANSFSNYNKFKNIIRPNCFWTTHCHRTTKFTKYEVAELEKIVGKR